MTEPVWKAVLAGLAVFTLVGGGPALADLEGQVGFYSGDNAEGYLRPLADAIGAGLTSGLFGSSYIPPSGTNAGLEIGGTAVWFSGSDRTFTAKTEGGFVPRTSARVSTVVGPGEAVVVDGEGGTTYMFPGGVDIRSFALGVPQIRFGSYRGTEGILRYFAADFGDEELGNLSLVGFGIRHSISQYLGPDFPVSIAGGFLWQRFRAGKNESGGDIFRSTAWTLGVQAGRIYGRSWANVEPYAGLSLDSHALRVAYTSEDDESTTIDLSFERKLFTRLTMGFLARLAVVGVRVEYSIGERSSLGFGLVLGRFYRPR